MTFDWAALVLASILVGQFAKASVEVQLVGEEVVDQTIESLRAAGILKNDYGFMRRVAWVETRFGESLISSRERRDVTNLEDNNTINDCHEEFYTTRFQLYTCPITNGGIWCVRHSDFVTARTHLRFEHIHILKKLFAIDIMTGNFEDQRFDQPLVSAIFKLSAISPVLDHLHVNLTDNVTAQGDAYARYASSQPSVDENTQPTTSVEEEEVGKTVEQKVLKKQFVSASVQLENMKHRKSWEYCVMVLLIVGAASATLALLFACCHSRAKEDHFAITRWFTSRFAKPSQKSASLPALHQNLFEGFDGCSQNPSYKNIHVDPFHPSEEDSIYVDLSTLHIPNRGSK